MVAGEQEEAGYVHSYPTQLNRLNSSMIPFQRHLSPTMSDYIEHVTGTPHSLKSCSARCVVGINDTNAWAWAVGGS